MYTIEYLPIVAGQGSGDAVDYISDAVPFAECTVDVKLDQLSSHRVAILKCNLWILAHAA